MSMETTGAETEKAVPRSGIVSCQYCLDYERQLSRCWLPGGPRDPLRYLQVVFGGEVTLTQVLGEGQR